MDVSGNQGVQLAVLGTTVAVLGGGAWYLNSKIDDVDDTLHQLTDRFAIILSKLHQHDDDIKISKSKLTEVQSFGEQLKQFQEDFIIMKDSLSMDINNIEKNIRKQNKQFSLINERIDSLYQNLGISSSPATSSLIKEMDDIEEVEYTKEKSLPVITKKKKYSKIDKKIPSASEKVNISTMMSTKNKDIELEDNVMAEMMNLGL